MALYNYAHTGQELAAARRCALYSWNNNGRSSRDSDLATLIMIYANGDGVPRNVDMAIRFVCESQPPDSLDPTIVDLLKAKASASPPRYDYCNLEIGLDKSMEYDCLASDLDALKTKRDVYLAKFISQWDELQKSAYRKTLKAHDAYAEAEAIAETPSGTGAGMDALQTKDDLEKEFADDIDQFERGKLPRFTEENYVAADKALNSQYRKTLAAWDRDAFGDPENLRAAERAWLIYRDAFVEFARLRWPGVLAETWLTVLTEERTRRFEKKF